MKRKKLRQICCVVLSALVLFGLWVWRVNYLNTNLKYKTKTENYVSGEMVPIEDNYFYDLMEDPAGYYVRVDSADVYHYEDFAKEIGLETDYYYYKSMAIDPDSYVYVLNVTFKNTDNENGVIRFGCFDLMDKSLLLNVDYTLWNQMEPEWAGYEMLKLKLHSEVSLRIPFTVNMYRSQLTYRWAMRHIREDSFSLCISHFPVRKLIAVDNVSFKEYGS